MTLTISAACAPDYRATEDDPGGRVRDELHEAPRVPVDERPGVGGVRDLRDPDLPPERECVRLGEPDVGDLRLCEDGRCRFVVVEVPVLTGVKAHDVLGNLVALDGGDRGEREAAG